MSDKLDALALESLHVLAATHAAGDVGRHAQAIRLVESIARARADVAADRRRAHLAENAAAERLQQLAETLPSWEIVDENGAIFVRSGMAYVNYPIEAVAAEHARIASALFGVKLSAAPSKDRRFDPRG